MISSSFLAIVLANAACRMPISTPKDDYRLSTIRPWTIDHGLSSAPPTGLRLTVHEDTTCVAGCRRAVWGWASRSSAVSRGHHRQVRGRVGEAGPDWVDFYQQPAWRPVPCH